MTEPAQTSRGSVQTRWMEVIVALLIVLGGATVIMDSLRVGITWADDGPKAGYFPFFIGCILVICGLWIVFKTIRAWSSLADDAFVTYAALVPVMSMLLPTIAYVVLIWLIGIYVASAIYIGGFMLWQGKFSIVTTLATSIGVPVAMFLLFEIWFLVPLPKGPVEHLIGY